MIRSTVKLNLSGFDNFRKQLQQGLAGGGGGEIGAMFTKWSARYLAFARRRFATLSAGGNVPAAPGDQGQWPQLKASTRDKRAGRTVTRVNQAYKHGEISAAQYATKLKAARGRSKRARLVHRVQASVGGGKGVLRDTGTLFNALTSGMPGNLVQRIKNGVRVGIAGPDAHPGGKASIADIAAFHNFGGGRLLRRQIIAQPDQQTQDGMRTDLSVCMKRLLAANKIKG
ncbi:MAG: hypothetical protein HZA50_11630 [Planctomycetes bacterium]|nr:hypothetical protein [Planctomycetota bacterium]